MRRVVIVPPTTQDVGWLGRRKDVVIAITKAPGTGITSMHRVQTQKCLPFRSDVVLGLPWNLYDHVTEGYEYIYIVD